MTKKPTLAQLRARLERANLRRQLALDRATYATIALSEAEEAVYAAQAALTDAVTQSSSDPPARQHLATRPHPLRPEHHHLSKA